MPEPGTLHNAFIDELRDSFDAEQQLLKALPALAKAADSADLRKAFKRQSKLTRGHVERLERVFTGLDETPRGRPCDGIAGIIDEAHAVMRADFAGTTMDACLIASGQRAAHYEMAAYGTLVAWARAMGHEKAADLLQEILDEEKAVDASLAALADGGINQDAANRAHTGDARPDPPAPAARVRTRRAARATA